MSGSNHTSVRKIKVRRERRDGGLPLDEFERSQRVIHTTSIRRALELLCGQLGFDPRQKVTLRGSYGEVEAFVLRPGGLCLMEPDGKHY